MFGVELQIIVLIFFYKYDICYRSTVGVSDTFYAYNSINVDSGDGCQSFSTFEGACLCFISCGTYNFSATISTNTYINYYGSGGPEVTNNTSTTLCVKPYFYFKIEPKLGLARFCRDSCEIYDSYSFVDGSKTYCPFLIECFIPFGDNDDVQILPFSTCYINFNPTGDWWSLDIIEQCDECGRVEDEYYNYTTNFKINLPKIDICKHYCFEELLLDITGDLHCDVINDYGLYNCLNSCSSGPYKGTQIINGIGLCVNRSPWDKNFFYILNCNNYYRDFSCHCYIYSNSNNYGYYTNNVLCFCY